MPIDNVKSFYEWASCARDLKNVGVPLLCVNADDDPIVSELPYEEVEANGWVAMVVTRGGGHLGWFTGPDGKKRWCSTPVVEWLRALTEDVAWGAQKVQEEKDKTEHVDSEGFTRLVEGGHEYVGYRVLATGGDVNAKVDNGGFAGL